MLRNFATLAVTLTAAAGLAAAPSGATATTSAGPAAVGPPPGAVEAVATGNRATGTTTLYKTVRGVRVAACRYPQGGSGYKIVRFDLDLTRASVAQARFQVNVRSGRGYRNPWSGWMDNGPTHRYYNGQGRGAAWDAYIPIENAMAVQARTDTKYGTSKWGKPVRWTNIAWCP